MNIFGKATHWNVQYMIPLKNLQRVIAIHEKTLNRYAIMVMLGFIWI